MDQFGELFTAAESPQHHSDLRQSILQQIRTMDHDLEMERRHIRTQQFMSQLNDAESGKDQSLVIKRVLQEDRDILHQINPPKIQLILQITWLM